MKIHIQMIHSAFYEDDNSYFPSLTNTYVYSCKEVDPEFICPHAKEEGIRGFDYKAEYHYALEINGLEDNANKLILKYFLPHLTTLRYRFFSEKDLMALLSEIIEKDIKANMSNVTITPQRKVVSQLFKNADNNSVEKESNTMFESLASSCNVYDW